MLKRLNNLQLLIILVLLLAAIVGVKLYDTEATDYKYLNKYQNIDSTTIHTVLVANTSRNNIVINTKAEDIVSVQYIYPANASYQVVKSGTEWHSGKDVADSTRTLTVLQKLDTIRATQFLDGASPYVLVDPEYILKLTTRNGDTTRVECFVRDKYLFMRSSQNPTNIFDGKSDSLFYKVYIGRSLFMPTK